MIDPLNKFIYTV